MEGDNRIYAGGANGRNQRRNRRDDELDEGDYSSDNRVARRTALVNQIARRDALGMGASMVSPRAKLTRIAMRSPRRRLAPTNEVTGS